VATQKETAQSLLQALTDTGDKVPLKGILHKGPEAAKAAPLSLNSFSLPEFNVPGRVTPTKVKDEQQRHIAELENQVAMLQHELEVSRAEGRKQAEEALTKGKTAGLALGQKEGENQAAQAFQIQLKDLQSEVANTLQTLNVNYEKRIQNLEAQSIDLTLGLAKRLWSIEAELHPERIAAVITEAFSHLGQAEKVVLRVHPLDADFAIEKQSLWQPINSSLKSLRVESDERVERGGCWIESEGGGNVDLRSEIIVTRLEQALRAAYQSTSE